MEDVELTSKAPDSEQIVFNFLEYLQDLKNEGKLSEDNMESVDVATQCLSSAFNVDLTNDVQKKKYSIKPQSLPTVFGLGVTGKEKLTKALEKLHKTHQQVNGGDLESRFVQYIANIKSKGYFNGVEPGSAEYEQRYIRARQKFIEKSKKPTTETKTEKMEIDAPPPVPPSLSRDEKNALAEKHKLEGNARLQEKQYSKAIEEYSKAISLSSDNPIYYANRAAAYSHVGKHQEAVEDCKKAISLKPDYGKAYGRLGLAYFSLGKYKDACEQYKKALEYEPNSPTLKESLLAAEKKLQEQQGTQAKPETPSTPAPQSNQPPRTPNFADLLNNPNLMNSLGSLFGRPPPAQPTSTSTTDPSATSSSSTPSTTTQPSTSTPPNPRGPLGGRNFNDILGSPQFQQFASQLASNPQIMQMANSLAQNPNAVNNIMQTLGIDPSVLEEENSTPPPQ